MGRRSSAPIGPISGTPSESVFFCHENARNSSQEIFLPSFTEFHRFWPSLTEFDRVWRATAGGRAILWVESIGSTPLRVEPIIQRRSSTHQGLGPASSAFFLPRPPFGSSERGARRQKRSALGEQRTSVFAKKNKQTNKNSAKTNTKKKIDDTLLEWKKKNTRTHWTEQKQPRHRWRFDRNRFSVWVCVCVCRCVGVSVCRCVNRIRGLRRFGGGGESSRFSFLCLSTEFFTEFFYLFFVCFHRPSSGVDFDRLPAIKKGFHRKSKPPTLKLKTRRR